MCLYMKFYGEIFNGASQEKRHDGQMDTQKDNTHSYIPFSSWLVIIKSPIALIVLTTT